MFNKKLGFILALIGLCTLFTGCASERFGDFGASYANETAAQKGVRYLLGRGVQQDDAKAFYYFSEAANENDPFAQNELGYLYAAGKGTQQDYTKSRYYYQKAAEHGLASAQYNLGLLYLHGLGTDKNPALARQWFEKSAALGFEPAKLALAHS